MYRAVKTESQSKNTDQTEAQLHLCTYDNTVHVQRLFQGLK